MVETVLITGASSGIGCELSHVFAREGYHLILVARNSEKLAALSVELGQKHATRVRVIARDLGLPSSPQALYDDVVADGDGVDILVNNAGIGIQGRFADLGPSRQAALMQLNMMKGKSIVIPGALNKLVAVTARLLPLKVTAAVSARLNRIREEGNA